jgi:hypothetical protein
MDAPHHGHHQQSRGGAMNHEGNSGTNSFGSYPHRSSHTSGAAAAATTTSSGIPF